MSQNRSHLIPTQTVDKNGVLTTRYKKPAGTEASVTSIPPATLTPAPLYAEGSPEHLCELLYYQYVDYMITVFEMMDEDDKKTLPLAAKLMTTGADSSRALVRDEMNQRSSEYFDAYNYSDDDELWRDRCRRSLSPNIKHALLAKWSLGEVIEETGSTTAEEFMMTDILDLDDYISDIPDRSGDESYWRALAAIVLTDISIGEERRSDARVFASWAGKQNNLPRIIEVAKERNTLHVLTIIGVIEEQDRAVAPLRQGAL